MKPKDLLELLKNVRADYVATLRDNHGLKKSVRPFKCDDYPIVVQLDTAIDKLRFINDDAFSTACLGSLLDGEK